MWMIHNNYDGGITSLIATATAAEWKFGTEADLIGNQDDMRGSALKQRLC